MKQKKWKSPDYDPRPNPIALAMCTNAALRSKVKPNKKGYRRTVKHRASRDVA